MLNTIFPGIDRESSALGFGCMRFPTNEDGTIHEAEAIRMVRYAIDHGVRYIDTAWPYHNQQSEIVVGKALQDGYRDRVILTSKLPCWLVNKYEDMMDFLDKQLEKLQTDHLDFYLLHALNEGSYQKMKVLDYPRFFNEALAQGKIRYPAFSFHDNHDTFRTILNDYDWKMAQVQMNILDANSQATLEGIREAGQKGVGIVIMEPLRGGLMANPPESVHARYQTFGVQRSAVEWAFRYLYTMPEVITILSGMSTMDQLTDNLDIFSRAEHTALTAEENELYEKVREDYLSLVKTRCTGCRYCQPCPQGVQIPRIFQGYDNKLLRGKTDYAAEYAKVIADQADASRCVMCRKCERACPQHLPITRYLTEIDSVSR